MIGTIRVHTSHGWQEITDNGELAAHPHISSDTFAVTHVPTGAMITWVDAPGVAMTVIDELRNCGNWRWWSPEMKDGRTDISALDPAFIARVQAVIARYALR